MTEKDMQKLIESRFRFEGIRGKKKMCRIFNILSYCKEIRNTAYPMNDSLVTEVKLVEFCVRKEKDLIYINGSLSLEDGERSEQRWLDAYIIEEPTEGKIRVYMDIQRLGVEDEPKMIRTSEELIEDEKNIMSITVYASSDSSEKKEFVEEFPKREKEDLIYLETAQQISATL